MREAVSITVIQVYVPTSNAEKTEVEWFYEDLQDLLEPFNFSFFSITGWDINLDYCDTDSFPHRSVGKEIACNAQDLV